MSHTQEPWKVEGGNILVAVAKPKLSLLAVDQDGYAIILSEEDARRIVACVNYCESLDTDGMESAVSIGETASKTINRMIEKELELTAQRKTAWQELHEIRESIQANQEESTADEVRRVIAQRDKLAATLADYTLTLQTIAQGKYAEGEESAMAQAALESAQKILNEVTA